MTRIAPLLCLLVCACATGRVTQPWPESPSARSSATSPGRAVHRMALGRLPPLRLREIALGTTLDAVTKGSVPSASGDVLCGTGASTATFQAVSSCWSDFLIGVATDANHEIGWTGFPATGTNVLRFRFGGSGNGMQLGTGDRMQIFASNGIELAGGRNSSSAPAAVTGSGASDPSLKVIGQGSVATIVSSGGGGLRVDNASTGTLISFIGRGTTTNPGAQAATSCGTVSITVTGAATGAECVVGLPSGYTSTQQMHFSCFVSAANTVLFRQCNTSGASITPTAGTYSVRVFNP